jgi:Helix-turn-helix domain
MTSQSALPTSAIQPMLTAAEVATLLHTSQWAVNKMARLRHIPGAKRIGRVWLFCRNDIQRFVDGKPTL